MALFQDAGGRWCVYILPTILHIEKQKEGEKTPLVKFYCDDFSVLTIAAVSVSIAWVVLKVVS